MSEPDLSELQNAVLTFDPAAVRAVLDKYSAASKEKLWCGEVRCVVLCGDVLLEMLLGSFPSI